MTETLIRIDKCFLASEKLIASKDRKLIEMRHYRGQKRSDLFVARGAFNVDAYTETVHDIPNRGENIDEYQRFFDLETKYSLLSNEGKRTTFATHNEAFDKISIGTTETKI